MTATANDCYCMSFIISSIDLVVYGIKTHDGNDEEEEGDDDDDDADWLQLSLRSPCV